ncbi:hypothetical protein [Escherichia coli]|uniref:hypothetical protein n=1 Tax=Escherichia coli TaxID=562 RepID=UPI001BCB587E|nr:hypothetical protein [Escherichia coli]
MRGAAPAALPARLSGQKVVYGCMQGTGVIFRDTVTVSGCLLLRPLRLPAAWRHPVVRPDSDRQLLAHPPVSAEPAGAVSGCRYGPEETAPDGAAVFPPAATPAACFPLWTFRGADVTPSRSICPG